MKLHRYSHYEFGTPVPNQRLQVGCVSVALHPANPTPETTKVALAEITLDTLPAYDADYAWPPLGTV